MALERTVERREYWHGPTKRLSWGATVAGSLVALAVMTLLGALGLAIGAEVVERAGEGMPSAATFGIAAVIWWIASGVIALFVGALVAARLGFRSRGLEGPLHGVVTWAVVTLVTLFLATSTIGALIGGGFGALHAGVTVDQGAETEPTEGEVAGETELAPVLDSLDLPEVSWAEIRAESRQIVRRIQRPDLDSEAIARETAAAEDELDAAIDRLYRSARDDIEDADKEGAITVLVDRVGMEQSEAERRVEDWSNRLEETWAEAKEGMSVAITEIQETPPEMVEAGAKGLSTAAWAMFFYLALTFVAAGLGGMLGAPRQRRERGEPEGGERVETTVERRPPETVERVEPGERRIIVEE